MEKYNVYDTALDAGGGEYPSQDGFGWTNGVLLKLRRCMINKHSFAKDFLCLKNAKNNAVVIYYHSSFLFFKQEHSLYKL
jgi:hypothetical protein